MIMIYSRLGRAREGALFPKSGRKRLKDCSWKRRFRAENGHLKRFLALGTADSHASGLKEGHLCSSISLSRSCSCWKAVSSIRFQGKHIREGNSF